MGCALGLLSALSCGNGLTRFEVPHETGAHCTSPSMPPASSCEAATRLAATPKLVASGSSGVASSCTPVFNGCTYDVSVLQGSCDGAAVRECGWGFQRCQDDRWTSCDLDALGYPVDPASGAPIREFHDPVLVFAPHPDDESIGLAGAILRERAQGHEVFLELMTHGEASGTRHLLESRGYRFSPESFGDARLREFRDAVRRLGVTGVHVVDGGDQRLEERTVQARVLFWREHATPLRVYGPEGHDDVNQRDRVHHDHAVVWRALSGMPGLNLTSQYIYLYFALDGASDYHGQPRRIADITPWCDGKRDALNAYKLWDPPSGRFAIGYLSVPILIDAASELCQEYAK